MPGDQHPPVEPERRVSAEKTVFFEHVARLRYATG
jgi:hypothetical protein